MRGPETLAHAVDRLTADGFQHEFVAHEDGLRAVTDGRVVPLDQLVIHEEVRFEGATDPGDQSILLALRTRDGKLRGTYVAPYGPTAGPLDAQVLRRFDELAKDETP